MEKSVCAICGCILVPFPLSLGSGCCIQERYTPGGESLKKEIQRRTVSSKSCKTCSANNDWTNTGLEIKKKGVTGNVRTVFKYPEIYWIKEVYNLLCMFVNE